jgi:hypothetical protein
MIPRLISAYLLGVVVIAAFFTWGQSPKEVSPEIVKQMTREAQGPIPYDAQREDSVILRALAVLTQQVADLEKTIDVHRVEIDSMDPQKNAERIFSLERDRDERREAEKRQAAANDKQWDRAWNAFLAIILLLVGIAAHMGERRWADWKRRTARDAVVDTKLNDIKRTADGLSDKRASVSRELGHTEGVAEEKAAEKLRSEN